MTRSNRTTGPAPPPRRRRGFGLIELTVTTVLAVAAMVITVQLVGWVAAERRSALRRERALLEAANLLERITARSWDALSTDPAQPPAVALSDAARAVLPGASLAVTVQPVEPAGPVAAKRVAVVIRWNGRNGTTEPPVRLVGWVHQPSPSREGKP